MDNCRITGNLNIVFIVWGSLGISDEVLKRANHKIYFSKITFPFNYLESCF
ncbi:23S rRNA (pseudouridine(1915)-N(3))-methyltransferase RlmH [Clostridium mediterraneense]|uniref:23S rRNA (pseudouridine(1915)-N(3))-methyltransferase RlmH n=1 Tax=Clostridium mediterraneense TaxID=1805472 RepID=UPI001F3A52BB